MSRAEARVYCAELGIDFGIFKSRNLPFHAEARRLVYVGLGTDGRDKFLAPGAAKAWRKMLAAANAEGVALLLISAFRSQAFQALLIGNKLQKGLSIENILAVNAPPGGSEHHSGCAVDVGAEGCPALEEEFEATAAFAWLQQHAARFRYFMSYPRGNAEGYLYEPWHWCWRPETDGEVLNEAD